MKKFLCVLTVAMSGAALMLSACGGSGGDAITDGGNAATGDDDNLTEVTATEAYEALSAIKTKFRTNVQSDSFNMTLEGGMTETVQFTEEVDGVSVLNSFENIEAQCLYDGEHFYGDYNSNWIEDGVDITDHTEVSYMYLMYRDTQGLQSFGNDYAYTFDSIADAINDYYNRNVMFLNVISEFLYELIEVGDVTDMGGFEFNTTVKMYSESDYINLYISYAGSSDEYKVSEEMYVKINLAANLTADDFEPISAE